MTESRLHIFGIRHHGPGSARGLVAALNHLKPVKILIEGPAEASHLIAYAGRDQMTPPLAILVYASQDPSHASFYPFAAYSPEWCAMVWGNENNIPAEFIDLPCAYRLAKALAQTSQPDTEISEDAPLPDKPGAEESPQQEALTRDPFFHLATLAGYDDAEAWWNDIIEEGHHGDSHFSAIENAVAALREYCKESTETLQREVYMRLQIHKTLQETDGTIAVVCGAWHAPALRDLSRIGADQKALNKLPKTKTEATWAPWSDRHLAAATGYGAGVSSPGWYQFLWRQGHQNQSLAATWQQRVAHLLRSEGLMASTAAVIEAARLSHSLAALRARPSPGLAEMNDASLSVLCGGVLLPLRLIHERLIIGASVGEVAPDVPQPPLQADLGKLLKKYRLKLETDSQELTLDLRSEAGIAKSVLFNRLLLLNIPWGSFLPSTGRGTFREKWRLCWDPAFSVRLNEAIRFGPTIQQAALNSAIEQVGQAKTVADAAKLVEQCLLADLTQAAGQAITRLESLSVQGNEVNFLIDAVVPLVNILRYGTARPIPELTLRGLTVSMMNETLVRLPYAVQNLDEQEGDAMMKRLGSFHHAVYLLADEDIVSRWYTLLKGLIHASTCNAGIQGLAAHFLYDNAKLAAEELHKLLVQVMSYGTPPLHSARWLEGFLSGSADIIIVDDALFLIMDEWLMALPEEDFMETIPLIRRAFFGFGLSQRHRLLAKVRAGTTAIHPGTSGQAIELDEGGKYFELALPLLATILNLSIGKE
ncbi:hypothetical protein MGMO_46c00040 [Methyloglobulus morosus KoM1]|uniref:Uncharacterized protein n=1 Tax=Methyloglobulus morosus KoM1 TaxID=1116472 RepID=V5C2S5_9GAMM|nr:DUF5682 family protein [Methyloglobulus morosus]ESS72762.1 hypothetical protein MGMO_46c00040 [Methyloglobulus morosus KoM1]